MILQLVVMLWALVMPLLQVSFLPRVIVRKGRLWFELSLILWLLPVTGFFLLVLNPMWVSHHCMLDQGGD